ncbi:hypothetical protein [Bacteroides fragilis]|uniref:hypothetical protein n=1 Tax=Bacteroides fragilis TaxID=817 RepID=UPI001C7012AC|nr:hypothetical protein [Bacteroides fragilis]MBW9277465.1 hypothetical protein [Bacteroides fragilis]
MKAFEELKEDLLTRAKNAGACQRGYAMGLRSETKADLLIAITENWFWVFREEKIVDAEYLEDNFTEEELLQAGIYIRGIHKVKTYSFALGSATVEAYDSATVEAYDSATVEAYGSATVEAYDSATVEAYDSATVEAYDSATVEAYDSATVEAYGSATVEAYDSATVKAYENSYVEDCIGNIRPQSDYAIVKDYYNHKIYIKKGKFEIIEV